MTGSASSAGWPSGCPLTLGFFRQGQPLPQGRARRGCCRGRQDQHLPRRTLPAHRQTRGKLKALVAVARSILRIIWQLLSDPTTRFFDLGPDYHANRVATERKVRSHIAQLTAMGFHVTLEPAA